MRPPVLSALVLLALAAPGPARGADDAAPVTVTTVRKGAIEDVVELTGTVTAERRASLSARTAGLVAKVPVDAGKRVKAGDVLLELDAALAALAVERAEAAAKEATADLTERERLYEEGRTLVRSGGIPSTEAEARRAALVRQQAVVSQLGVDQRERAEIVARHRVVAPFPGVISAKLTEVGEWVETGVPVLELVEVDAVRFDVQAPQERFAQLDRDTPVTVRLDSAPTDDFPARIRTKVPVKDAVARTFLVRLDVEAPSSVMAPGVSGRARFRLAGADDALVVPRDALVRLPDGSTVAWVVEGEGDLLVARRRPVETGGRLGAEIEINRGLEAGERVVLRGNESLRDGQAVRVIDEQARNSAE